MDVHKIGLTKGTLYRRIVKKEKKKKKKGAGTLPGNRCTGFLSKI